MIDLIAKKNCPGWGDAQAHLTRIDPVLKEVIARVGPCTLAPRNHYFAALCQSIISQQISTAAAQTVWDRFRQLHPRRTPRPPVTLKLSDDTLRSAGLSRQKACYIRSLAAAFDSGAVPVHKLRYMSDQQVIDALIPIKGIGRWTAEMFLIFVLNRSDLLPVDDLVFQQRLCTLYSLSARPKAGQIIELAEKWRPYRSIATWYLWRGGAAKTVTGAPAID